MKFLSRAYTKYNPENKAWVSSLLWFFVVLLIFLLFQPFGFKDKDLALKAVLFPGYALFAYLSSYFNFHIVRYLLKKKKKWTIRNEFMSMLISVLVVTFTVYLFSWWITGDMPFSFRWYFKLFYHVASLYLVIGIIEFFYYNYRDAGIKTKKLARKYKSVKYKLEITEKQDDEMLFISLEKEKKEVSRNKIVFIQSIGNYLELNLLNSNREIVRISKRGRLHLVEKDLALYSEFFKCHRAFIVNLKKVKRIKGNIKNAKVVFEDIKEEIPVSRPLYANLKKILEKQKLS